MTKSVQGHQKGAVVTDLQFSSDRTYFITASKDKTAKVDFLNPFCSSQIFDTNTLDLLKTYISDTPLNTAAITPAKDFVLARIHCANYRLFSVVVKKLATSPQHKSAKENLRLDSIIKSSKKRSVEYAAISDP